MKQVKFRLGDDDYMLLQENLNCSVPAYCKTVAMAYIQQLNNRNILPEDKQFVSLDLRNDLLTDKFTFLFSSEQKTALEQAAKKTWLESFTGGQASLANDAGRQNGFLRSGASGV